MAAFAMPSYTREREGGGVGSGSVLVFAFYMNSDGAENPFVLTLLRQSDTAQGVAYQI